MRFAGKQTLIFCSSKKGTEKLAHHLVGKVGYQQYMARRGRGGPGQPQAAAVSLHEPQLGGLIRNGIAYHHGGLPADDRAYVEQEYLSGNILVLVATSTLAYGVNLPAHLVLIKGKPFATPAALTTALCSSSLWLQCRHQPVARGLRRLCKDA